MTRKDLESKVRIRWETADDGRGTRRCEGEFVASCAALVDPLVLRGLGAGRTDIEEPVEKSVRREIADSLLRDLETENLRLRAALEKWGRRAISRQFPSCARDAEQAGEGEELKEDLK